MDIVERLRNPLATDTDGDIAARDAIEAADEIERLRGEVFTADRAWRAAKREIAKLREELAAARNERDCK